MTLKLETNLHKLFCSIRRAREEHGPVFVVERSKELLEALRKEPNYVSLLDANDSRRIAPEVLFPEADRVRPVAINVIGSGEHQNLRLNFQTELLPVLRDVVAALCGDMHPVVEALSGGVLDVYRTVVQELEHRDMVLPRDSDVFAYEERNCAKWMSCDATFVGHNTVVVRSKKTRLVVDPWFPRQSKNYPRDYQPVLRSELGNIDALLITHSHPDHFDMGALLRFGAQPKIIVPKVDKESILAIDMALRLRELGFQDVQTMDWWQEKWIGDIKVIALPFYGEQPTNGYQLCPEVRNVGNTYLVQTPRFACAFLADSGRDRLGDVRNVAYEAYRRWGGIDVLFAGYRGWYLYPIQYVWSSVSHYLLFVPPELYTVRQAIMNNTAEAVDTAEAWHARYLAPYANGGAPWYWANGLGPALNSDGTKLNESLHFDPFPERCLEELRMRSAPSRDTLVGSLVSPLLLRPGESVQLINGEARTVESEHHTWPWKP
jgi:L-ascorbate metabolism protein UlaG (beta-lactamase superfamily)